MKLIDESTTCSAIQLYHDKWFIYGSDTNMYHDKWFKYGSDTNMYHDKWFKYSPAMII